MKITADIIPILVKYGISYKLYENDSVILRSVRRTQYINISYDNLELIQILLDRGAQPNELIPWFTNPDKQQMYCSPNNHEIIELFLDKGADVNTTDDQGQTMLFWNRSDKKVVQLLIKHGINVNHQDINGDTMLHRLIQHSNKFSKLPMLTKMVLDAGYDLTLQNKNGDTFENILDALIADPYFHITKPFDEIKELLPYYKDDISVCVAKNQGPKTVYNISFSK